MHEEAKKPDQAQIKAGHLAETANTKALWIFFVSLLSGIFVCIGLAAVVMWIYSGNFMTHDRQALPAQLPGQGTAHWISPVQELNQVHEQQTKRLNGYGWVDRDQGIARIPIQDAMQVVAERAKGSSSPSTSQPATTPARNAPAATEHAPPSSSTMPKEEVER